MSIFENKALANMKARANLVRSDLLKSAEEFDARHPGPTFSRTRLFRNILSPDVGALCGFIALEHPAVEFRDFARTSCNLSRCSCFFGDAWLAAHRTPQKDKTVLS